eukprot:11757460-Alexandrium_andersonii.AAC.1
MGWTSGGDGGQHDFAEGVPDFGTATSWCRTSGSETPWRANCFTCFQVDPPTVQAQCWYFTLD